MKPKQSVFLRCVITSLALVVTTLSLTAQTKVGLALSGGGAKGFAHVGAMEIIDSLNIPIHMVSGTSMGAVVGGLYAIGYSSEQGGPYFLNINSVGRWAYELKDKWVIQPNTSLVMTYFNTPTLPYAAFLGGLGENYFNNQLPFVGFRYRELGTTRSLDDDDSFFRFNAATVGVDLQYELQKNTYVTALFNLGTLGRRPSDFYNDPEWVMV